MYRIAHALAAALALSAALSGCSKVSTQDAAEFNNTMVRAHKRVGDAGKEFVDTIAAAIDGQVMDVAMARSKFEFVVEAIDRAHADTRTLRVPKSPSAQAFYDAQQALLAKQEQVVKEDFKAIVKVLDDPLITPQERINKLRPIARYLRSLDAAEQDRVKQAQAAFAREHGITLKK
jgi:hypothetical protein